MNNRLLVCIWLLLASFNGMAIDVYEFSDPAEEDRFRSLLDELRCPKCQNQSLASSDAMIARDMKDKIYELMQEGKTDEEITQYFVMRYGDFITYKPPVKGSTLYLWVVPYLVLLLAVGFVFSRRRKTSEASEERLKRAEELLRGEEKDG